MTHEYEECFVSSSVTPHTHTDFKEKGKKY